MRIAYDHQIFAWQEYGGISRYFYELATRVAATEGNEALIFAPNHGNLYLRDQPPACLVGDYSPRMRKASRFVRQLNALSARAMLWRYRPDIVHETYYSAFRVAPPGTRTVLTVYDMIHEKLPRYFGRPEKLSRKKLAAVKRADHVICISEHTRRDLIELFAVPEEKTSVVHLGLALTTDRQAALPMSLVGKPYVLYVGDRGGYKNFSTLLEAFAASPTLRESFRLVCFGGGELREAELAMIGKYGLDQARVIQLRGDDALLASLYRNAGVFVYPSLYEGFGISPLEAMGFGCPVICSDRASLPEVVGDAAILVDPDRPEAIRSAMESVIDPGAARSALIAKGYERARHFSWDTCAERTLRVYRKVLGS